MIEETWLVSLLDEAVSKLANRGVAVDVGANVGTWSELLSESFETVIAIEPDERAYDLIPQVENIDLVPAAAGETAGVATLYKRPESFQNSLLEHHPIDGRPVVDREQVEVVTLDGLLPEGAEFVKVDVEGGEVAVLRGCSADGRWGRAYFLVECHDNFSEVESELVRLGKSVERIPHPSTGAHPGHCWAFARPNDPVESVVRAGRRDSSR